MQLSCEDGNASMCFSTDADEDCGLMPSRSTVTALAAAEEVVELLLRDRGWTQ